MCSRPSLAYSPSRLSRSVTNTCGAPASPEPDERLGQVGGLGGVAARVGAVALEGRVRRVAVLGDPQRPAEAARLRATRGTRRSGARRCRPARAGGCWRCRTCGARRRPGVANTRSSQPGSCGRISPPSSTWALGTARLDAVVGGAQHPGVLLRRPLERPLAVGLVEDLPVVDRAAACSATWPASAPNSAVSAAAHRLGSGFSGHAEVKRGGASRIARTGRSYFFDSAVDLVEAAPVRRVALRPVRRLEDRVHLDVDADVLRAERPSPR